VFYLAWYDSPWGIHPDISAQRMQKKRKLPNDDGMEIGMTRDGYFCAKPFILDPSTNTA